MPRGKYVNHKGRSRHFTAPEELEQESDENSEETGSGESNDESGATGGASGSKGAASSKSSVSSKQSQQKNRKAANVSSSEEDSDEDDDDDSDAEARGSKKGVASLIEIENPNRVIKKATQKVTHLSIEENPNKPELTRREREQIEKEKARQRYKKLHAAGKTTEAKADLARLALIRQQREEAAAKREAEKKAADVKKPAGKA